MRFFKRKHNLAILIILFLLSAFGLLLISPLSSPKEEAVVVSTNQKQKDCERDGGEWEQVGIRQEFDCIIALPDAGKECKSSDECEGSCIRVDKNESFKCQNNNILIGCFSRIEDCKNGNCPLVCVD